jgi:hypothetical protein
VTPCAATAALRVGRDGRRFPTRCLRQRLLPQAASRIVPQILSMETPMFGWLASHAASFCRQAGLQPASRRWMHTSPWRLARQLPQLGSVLYLPGRITATADELPPGLLAERLELTPLLQTCRLAAVSVIGSDGPHEWLECFDRHDGLRARLHLLPDTDYLGWDALLASTAPSSAPGPPWPRGGFRAENAGVLRFRLRPLAGLHLLEADAPVAVSTLGRDIAGGIARAEAVELCWPAGA